MVSTRVNNATYQTVVGEVIKTIDDVAYKVRERYNHIYNFT
jgi:hypothetical protein